MQLKHLNNNLINKHSNTYQKIHLFDSDNIINVVCYTTSLTVSEIRK